MLTAVAGHQYQPALERDASRPCQIPAQHRRRRPPPKQANLKIHNLTPRARLGVFAFAVEPVEGRLGVRTLGELSTISPLWGFQSAPSRPFTSLAAGQEALAALRS